MKKIINGSRYDTAKATRIATASSEHPSSDFRYWEEAIYRTPRGRWFAAGSGGPMSRYSRSRGNTTSGGDAIKPLTEEQARAWLESYDSAGALAALERYFAARI